MSFQNSHTGLLEIYVLNVSQLKVEILLHLCQKPFTPLNFTKFCYSHGIFLLKTRLHPNPDDIIPSYEDILDAIELGKRRHFLGLKLEDP